MRPTNCCSSLSRTSYCSGRSGLHLSRGPQWNPPCCRCRCRLLPQRRWWRRVSTHGFHNNNNTTCCMRRAHGRAHSMWARDRRCPPAAAAATAAAGAGTRGFHFDPSLRKLSIIPRNLAQNTLQYQKYKELCITVTTAHFITSQKRRHSLHEGESINELPPRPPGGGPPLRRCPLRAAPCPGLLLPGVAAPRVRRGAEARVGGGDPPARRSTATKEWRKAWRRAAAR